MNPLANLLLMTVSPLQHVLDRPSRTHGFCNVQGMQILAQDCVIPRNDFFAKYKKEIVHGGYWADSQWKNIDHYLEPETGRGIWPFGNALDQFRQYFAFAFKEVRRGDCGKAAFYLGAASHLVQDMCVPHHARGRMFNGHQEFEAWAGRHFEEYSVRGGGLYTKNDRVVDFICENARIAATLLDAVDTDKGCVDYTGVAAILLPLAQQSTAGLFAHFYRRAFQTCPVRFVPVTAIVA